MKLHFNVTHYGLATRFSISGTTVLYEVVYAGMLRAPGFPSVLKIRPLSHHASLRLTPVE